MGLSCTSSQMTRSSPGRNTFRYSCSCESKDSKPRAEDGTVYASPRGVTARRSDGKSVAAIQDDLRGEGVECARQGRGSDPDARLLVRATADAPPERQARHRRRRDGEEAPANAADPARAERRQARDAG